MTHNETYRVVIAAKEGVKVLDTSPKRNVVLSSELLTTCMDTPAQFF